MLPGLRSLGCALCLFFTAGMAMAADKPLITPTAGYSNLFGGKDMTYRVLVTTATPWKGRAAWSYTTLNNRTIRSGEADIDATAGRPGQFEVRLGTPEVKPGVVLRTRLRVSLISAEGARTDAVGDKTIWVYPDDPFVDRKERLKELKISLFDPEKTTTAALEKLGVPFEPLASVAAAGELKEGLLLVGEGVSFKEYPDLMATMTKLAGAGRPVLCLAPISGGFPVPAAGIAGPSSLEWKKQSVILGLDKRLDAIAWPPSGSVVASSFTLTPDSSLVVAEAAAGDGGWAWFEAQYPNNGRVVICGFGLLGKSWEAGPTPRYLFARMLEHVTRKPAKTTAEETEK